MLLIAAMWAVLTQYGLDNVINIHIIQILISLN